MKNGRFNGIYPAVVSPRNEHGGFGVAAFERLIHRLFDAGVQGLYVCGNTAETRSPPRGRWMNTTLRGCGPTWKRLKRTYWGHDGGTSEP